MISDKSLRERIYTIEECLSKCIVAFNLDEIKGYSCDGCNAMQEQVWEILGILDLIRDEMKCNNSP